jgi:predicted peroxiredoxin
MSKYKNIDKVYRTRVAAEKKVLNFKVRFFDSLRGKNLIKKRKFDAVCGFHGIKKLMHYSM